MGSGATKMRRSISEAGGAAQDFPAGISVEEGMQWLKTMVDKEKAEKEWLAGQYENQCAEMKKLREEMALLRHELTLSRQRANSASSQSPNEAQTKQDARESEASPVSNGQISPKLQQRRAIKLTIDAGEHGNRGASTDIVKLPSLTPQPSSESVQIQKSPSPAKEAVTLSLPSIGSKTSLGQEQPTQERRLSVGTLRTGGVAGDVVNNDDEPMSALLRRRKEDWSVSADKPSESDNTDEVKPLLVATSKVQIMDEPSSPKRIKTNRMRSSAGLRLDIVKGGESFGDASADPAAVKNGGN